VEGRGAHAFEAARGATKGDCEAGLDRLRVALDEPRGGSKGPIGELVDAQQQLLATARASSSLQEISYQAGKSDLLLLLVAQRAYAKARLGLAQAQGQRLSDTAQLFGALGGGWWESGI
jgi:Outer membrane efflux protein